MNCQSLVQLLQQGCVTPKEPFTVLEGLRTSSPLELCDLIKSSRSPRPNCFPPPIERESIGHIATRFHQKAGTLTNDVRRNIHDFLSDAPILRIPHQPNLFPYMGVFGQFIFMDMLAQCLRQRNVMKPCQVYMIVDYDVAEERRFRVSHFPDVDARHGSISLSSIPKSAASNTLMCFIRKPTSEMVSRWLSLITDSLRRNIAHLRSKGISETQPGDFNRHLRDLEQDIWKAYEAASNMCEFNAIFMSRVVNLRWGMPTAFFSLMQVASHMTEYFEFLLAEYPRLVELTDRVIESLQAEQVAISDTLRLSLDLFPFWYICEACRSRVRLELIRAARLKAKGHCSSCGSPYEFDLGTQRTPNLEAIRGEIAPRVLLDDWTDMLGWGVIGGAAYIGGIEHTLVAGIVASKLGLKPIMECLWKPTGIYFGLVEARVAQFMTSCSADLPLSHSEALELVAKGRETILYSVIAQGFDGVLRMWREHFENGRKTYDINLGTPTVVLTDDMMSHLEDLIADLA